MTVMQIEVDPTKILPGDLVIRINDYADDGCHCDVRVTVKRETTP